MKLNKQSAEIKASVVQANSMFDNLWVEKYRPHKLEDLILSDENELVVKKFVDIKEIPNLLFVGSPGVGKTTLAKIIVNDILECQYLYINASDENGIDTIRSKVTQFAQVMSLDGNIKVIILDECDGLSQDAQRALRNTMEQYVSVTRFVLTANYGHKIISALQSRCQSLNLTPPLDVCVDRVNHILKNENVVVSDNQEKQLEQFVKNNYPDLRRINELQKYCSNKKLHIANTEKNVDFLAKIWMLISKGHVLKVRKFIIENESKFDSDYPRLLKWLFDYVDGLKIRSDDQKKMYLIVIAEALYRSAFVVDQEINCYSCLIQLSPKP